MLSLRRYLDAPDAQTEGGEMSIGNTQEFLTEEQRKEKEALAESLLMSQYLDCRPFKDEFGCSLGSHYRDLTTTGTDLADENSKINALYKAQAEASAKSKGTSK